jgi:hypothetical protein
MNSQDKQIIFYKQSTAQKQSGSIFTIDNYRHLVLCVATGAGTPVSQVLKVYGSLGLTNTSNAPIDFTAAASQDNPYGPLLVKDLNNMESVVGTDGITISANMVKLYEINTNGVRDVFFELVGSGVETTVIIKPYA